MTDYINFNCLYKRKQRGTERDLYDVLFLHMSGIAFLDINIGCIVCVSAKPPYVQPEAWITKGATGSVFGIDMQILSLHALHTIIIRGNWIDKIRSV